ERLPMNVAAAVHELLEVRRRLERGGAVEEGDAGRATFAVDRLSEELIRPRVASPPPPATLELPDEESHEVFEAPVHTSRRFRGGGDLPVWGIAAGALIGIIAIAAWFLLDRGPNQLEQGIALFRTGAYADAASHFWRYAEENPDDPTPQLYLARIHRRMDRPELAAEALRIAQDLAPSDPAVHRELGFLLLDTGRADVAVDRFRTAIDMDSTSSEGWVGLVRALRE